MKIKLLVLFVLSVSCAAAQVKLISVDQMEKRFISGKDTTFVVNFWATWCGPCVEELPYFDQLQKNYKNKKVKVMLVSLDFKSKLQSDVVPFVKKMRLSPELYLINEAKQQTFIDRISTSWSGAIPATLIVNKQQRFREFYEKEFTYKDLVSTLETAMK